MCSDRPACDNPGQPAAGDRVALHPVARIPLRRSRDEEEKPVAPPRTPPRGRPSPTARPGRRARTPEQTEKRRLRDRLREGPARFIGRNAWLRRRYARMILRSIEKRRRKDKPLPDNLVELERRLRGMPPAKREQMLEQVLEYQAEPNAVNNRAARRAAERPERMSGRGKGRRPGMPAGQRPRQRPR